MKLTKSVIDRATYEGNNGERFVLWDDCLSGFGLRIYPSGRKAFILSYRFQGRKRLLTLGDFGELTLDQARERAMRANLGAKDGNDPLAVRRREASGETFGDLCKTYLVRHATDQKKKSWKQDECRLDRFFGGIERRGQKTQKPDEKKKQEPKIARAWVGRKIKSITSEDVATLHLKIGKSTPYEANRLLALLSKMFELAKQWKMLDANFPNPARGIERFKEQKRDRWLTPEELPKLAQAIETEANIYVRAALWLYLFTGARKSELLTAKWVDIDFQRCELRLPETKASRVHYIPLSPPAVDLLRALPRERGNPHLLPGHITGRPLVNISKPWLRIRKTAGIEDVRLHDLRRTVGSWLAQSGHSLHLIGKTLNHSNVSTTAVYAHLADGQVRHALDQHATKLLGVMKKAEKNATG